MKIYRISNQAVKDGLIKNIPMGKNLGNYTQCKVIRNPKSHLQSMLKDLI